MPQSFADWSGGGAPQGAQQPQSFAQWSSGGAAPALQAAPQAQGTGYKGYSQDEMRWLLNHGNEQLTDQAYADLQKDPMWQSMLKKGAFSVGDPYQNYQSRTVHNESGDYEIPDYSENLRLAKTPFDMPKIMGGQGQSKGSAGWSIVQPGDTHTGSYSENGLNYSDIYQDPVYGAVRHWTEKKDFGDVAGQFVKMAAFGMALGPMAAALAPGLAAATGIPEWLASSAIKAVPGIIQSGGKNVGNVAASLAGSATGIPMGGAVGNMLYNYATKGQAPTAQQAGMTFANYLAGQAMKG